jgi:DNA polymerase-3 subunit gamma/tau
VENVREIRESIRYAAAPGKHRIFIIDEIHMLSQAAFNALLKTLEEPPPRSLFIFATTDPKKIPATVLSRVQRFDLKRLGSKECLERLREITSAESIEIPESVLRTLVRESDGSLRDAQTLLDRLISGLGSSIQEEEAIAILDLIDRRILRDILDPVLAGDPGAALLAVRRAIDKGIDPPRLTRDLLEEIRNLVVARVVEDPGELLEAAPDEVEEIRERARPHDPEALDRLFRVLLTRAQELPFAPQPAHALEMAIVRLASLPDSDSIAELLRRLDGPGEPSPNPPRGTSGGRPGSSGGASGRSGGSGGRTSGGSGRPSGTRRAEGGSPPLRRDPERLARIRQETKSHPAVRRVIETFDAELRDIDIPDGENG